MSNVIACKTCGYMAIIFDNELNNNCPVCNDVLHFDKNLDTKTFGHMSITEREQYIYKHFDSTLQEELVDKRYDYMAEKRNRIRSIGAPLLKCPTCNSTHVTKISGLERGVSIGFFGLFSKKINKSFKCNNCSYTW